MNTLYDSARPVKSPRPFGRGIAPRGGRRQPFTADDLRWWAENSPSNATGFDVIGPSDAALDLAAGCALAEARMSAGFAIL